MLSLVALEMVNYIPGLIATPSTTAEGEGILYSLKDKIVGSVRSLDEHMWHIDGDPEGDPFTSEREATIEMLRRVNRANSNPQ